MPSPPDRETTGLFHPFEGKDYSTTKVFPLLSIDYCKGLSIGKTFKSINKLMKIIFDLTDETKGIKSYEIKNGKDTITTARRLPGLAGYEIINPKNNEAKQGPAGALLREFFPDLSGAVLEIEDQDGKAIM